MAKLMSETFGMFGQRTLLDLPNVISSPESELGPTPCVVPVGPMIDAAGPAPALASLSARAAKEKGLLTSGTYGRRGSISSASADLQWSMASRLREVTAKLGSTLFRLTWKEKVTRFHRSIYRLRASGRRTSGREFTSWPTPESLNQEGYQVASGKKYLRTGSAAQLAAWPTPTKGNADGSETGRRTMNETAKLAAWPTPQSHDERERGNVMADHHHFPHDLSNAAILASWPTPHTPDGEKGGPNQHGSKGDLMLPSLNEQAVQLTASGPTPNGSTAETRNTGQLNPAHSRWLQGLPPEWDACAVTATRSARRSRKPS